MALENLKSLSRGNPLPVLFLLLLAGITVGSCSVEQCGHTGTCAHWRGAWGITWGFVSAILSAAMLALSLIRPDTADKGHRFFAPVMFGVWVASAAILTSSSGIFPIAGNGYFFTWIATFTSLYYWSFSMNVFGTMSNLPSLHGLTLLVIFSCIEWATAAEACGVNGNCGGRWGFALFVGVLTTVVAGTQIGLHFFMADLANRIALYVGMALFVTWIFGTAFNTSSNGPFPYTGNGYLASWACFFVSLYFAMAHSPLAGPEFGAGDFGSGARAHSPGFETGVDDFESRVTVGPHDA